MARIHIVLDDAEKERFRQQAEREGRSLADWLRQAARDRLAAAANRARLNSVEDLRAFFSACAAREADREPDWADHRRVIEGSLGSSPPS